MSWLTRESTLLKQPRVAGHTAAGITANAAIAALWLWLYWPLHDYLAIIFSRDDFRTNQIVLVAAVALIASQVYRGRLRLHISAGPQLYLPALGLVLVGSVLYLLVERFLDINTLSATLFGLATYGLVGLWMGPARWRQGLPAALLLIGALPFGDHMQTFVGYPMRLATAVMIRDGLAAAGISSIGADTILVFESGVAQVDLPCSGVKSLWTGALFLLAATWIERRPLDRRWFLLLPVFAALLFTANVVRVAILVLVGQVAGLPFAAGMLHVPLGVLGFGAACLAALVLLRRGESIAQVNAGDSSRVAVPPAFPARGRQQLPARPVWLAPALAVAILAMALSYAARPQTGLARPASAWRFADGLVTQPMPLGPDELESFIRSGAESAERLRFQWQGVTGSMILITSQTWRSQHRPERCFEVYGLTIDGSHTQLVTPDFPVRVVSLGRNRDRNLFSAVYWLQSATRTTDDFGLRMWADLAPERERWVLVSILFDGSPDLHSPAVTGLYGALHDSVASYLQGGIS